MNSQSDPVKPNPHYQTIRQLKEIIPGPYNQFRLEFRLSNGKTLGSFSPVTIKTISDETIIKKLTDWREIHKKCFFTQFDSTTARTKKWLQEIIVPDDSKILFIIHDADGIPIGNYGLRNITESSAELDNLLIGDSKKHGPLILAAMKSFINWAFSEFHFQYLTAAIFSQNDPVIFLHKKMGFLITNRIPVRKIERPDMIQYLPTLDEDPHDEFIIEMTVTRLERYMNNK